VATTRAPLRGGDNDSDSHTNETIRAGDEDERVSRELESNCGSCCCYGAHHHLVTPVAFEHHSG
jgi:hypothetical protein